MSLATGVYKSTGCGQTTLEPQALVLTENERLSPTLLDTVRNNVTSEPGAHSVLTLRCKDCGHKWKAPMRCGDRLCKECRLRDYRRIMARFNELQTLDSAKMKRPKLLTLTVRSSWNLKQQYREIRAAWGHIIRQKWFKAAVVGGIYVVEITHNPNQGYHSHMHILMDSEYIPRDNIIAAWERLTGAFIVDIRPVRGFGKAVAYVMKYMAKPPQLKGSAADEYRAALKGARLVHGFGKYYRWLQLLTKKRAARCPECGCGEFWIYEFEEPDVLQDLYMRWDNS